MSNRYNTPDPGATDWHRPLNENFEALEADVEIRDSESALEEYEPEDGAKFVVDGGPNRGDVYFGTGEEWERVGRIGETPAYDVLDDPDAVDDWGAAVNDWIDDAAPRDVLLVPPGEYESYTTAEIDDPVTIVSPARGGRRTITRIEAQSDDPFVDGGASVPFAIGGFQFYGSGTDQEYAVQARGQLNAWDIECRRIGSRSDEFGDGIRIVNLEDDDNANQSKTRNISGNRCGGSTVYLDAEGVTTDVNACEIHVASSSGCGGWAIDGYGWGNRYEAMSVQGGEHDGGIRVGRDSHAYILYWGTTGPVPFEATGSNNWLEIIYSTTDYDDFEDENDSSQGFLEDSETSNNWFVLREEQYYWNDSGPVVYDHRIEATNWVQTRYLSLDGHDEDQTSDSRSAVFFRDDLGELRFWDHADETLYSIELTEVSE